MCYDEIGSKLLPAKGNVRRKSPVGTGGFLTASTFFFRSAAEEGGFSAVPEGFAGSAGGPVIQTDKMK